MDAPLRHPRIGGRFVAWLDEITGRARRRRLEEELVRADAEIARLRALLADATRPPTQFARMREREVAVRRLTRLQIARPARTDALARQLIGVTSDWADRP
ncbi:MAG TPA: hypothetical protein VLA76_03915 [Candidatus Angelobacter sp.]|nr:hypothetical protein [Candidatus Angelobacter sp.]